MTSLVIKVLELCWICQVLCLLFSTLLCYYYIVHISVSCCLWQLYSRCSLCANYGTRECYCAQDWHNLPWWSTTCKSCFGGRRFSWRFRWSHITLQVSCAYTHTHTHTPINACMHKHLLLWHQYSVFHTHQCIVHAFFYLNPNCQVGLHFIHRCMLKIF